MTSPASDSSLNLPDHAARNRVEWNGWAHEYVDNADRNWQLDEPVWGIWSTPESEVQLLGDMTRFAGRDVIELGCGTAYVSAWLARAGARVTGIDISDAQLDTARKMLATYGEGLDVTLQLASGETVPYPDASFDVVISEMGAALWADPYLWIPEAARVLRPGGELIFITNHNLYVMCGDELGANVTTTLHRPLYGMHATEWPDDDTTDFHLPHGKWIDLMHANGLRVERLVEFGTPPADDSVRFSWSNPEWARKWPSEEAWIARKA